MFSSELVERRCTVSVVLYVSVHIQHKLPNTKEKQYLTFPMCDNILTKIDIFFAALLNLWLVLFNELQPDYQSGRQQTILN